MESLLGFGYPENGMSANSPFHISGSPVIVGTGLISLDIVLGPDESAPPRLYAGGTCGNLLIIMSYLGWKSFPVSRMNGDEASKHVVADLKYWGVQTDWATTGPGSNTPIIVQRIRRSSTGEVSHRFSWTCPTCGAWLPGYSAVPARAAHVVSELVKEPQVFFFDRVSRGAIDLATAYRATGSLVVFEPSGIGEPRLFREAIECAHIVKYSEDRIHEIEGLTSVNGPLLEIQTRGSEGLRYRLIGGNGPRCSWTKVSSIAANSVRDTSGAGDWCTAGIIHCLGTGGWKGLGAASDVKIRRAVRFGQAMAAWNCKFEGARGGMYAFEKRTFRAKVRELFEGRDVSVTRERKAQIRSGGTVCLGPTCRAKSKPKP